VFLGRTKDTMIPAIALPLSLLLTFVAMHVLGYSLDNLSLMALTLAIGFLVDDAIVFLENTVRLMEEGRSALDASLESAKEISFTIVAMTVSLAAVFIPLVFMSGLMGRIFREFSITIVISILAGGLVSLTLTPLMTSRMLDNRGKGSKKTWMERAFGAVERRVLNGYGRSLWFFLSHRWISATAWVLCLAGTGHLFYIVPKSFLPIGDSSFIRGVMVTQEGSSPEQLKAYQAQADQIIRANPAVSTSFTISGASGVGTSNQVMLFAFLKDRRNVPRLR
jgi:hydrophobic/amphiphilic exporter-1 (mainly G- bacteria), HAE1 family